MGNATKEVTYCVELDTLLSIVIGLIADVKAGASVPTILADEIPAFMSALMAIGQLGPEIQANNGAAIDATLALKLVDLKQVLLPGVV